MAKLADMIAHGKYLKEEEPRLFPELTQLRRKRAFVHLREFARSLGVTIREHSGSLNQTQAAEITGVKRWTINRAVKAGKLRTNGRTGRACRVDPDSLLDWVDRRRALSLRRASLR